MTTARRPLLLALCMVCLPLMGQSGEADRIEDILHRQTFRSDGQRLISVMRATVEGCVIRLNLEKPGACEGSRTSPYSTTDYIDVRALVVNRDAAEITDFSGTQFEKLKGAVSYRYRPIYNRLLRLANKKEGQIRDEGYKTFPTDVEARLRVLSKRNREEINANLYAQSFEITRFCSGTEIRGPLTSQKYSFFVEPSDAEEFAALIEELSQTCRIRIGS